MPRLPWMCIFVFCICRATFADGEVSRDAFQQAAKDYERYANGKRLVVESGTDRVILELNEDQSVMRFILEKRDIKANILTHRFAHYASLSLSQHVMATSMEDSRTPETNSVLHSVEFLPPGKTLLQVISELGVLNFAIQDQLISEVIDQSECVPLSATPGRKGVRCVSPDKRTAEVWINDKGQLLEVIEEIKPGDKLANGQVCPPGKWTRISRKIQWDPISGKLAQFQSSVKADGGISGSRNYVVKEESRLEAPLKSLIQLEDFELKDGVAVTCQAQPGKPFQFIRGKVVAMVDASSLASAQSSRWWGSPTGSLLYNLGIAGFLVAIVSILLWKRTRS